MIVFCLEEFLEGDDLGNDRISPQFFGSQFLDRLFSDSFLLSVMVEDNRSVLCSLIRSLAVQSCWVVNCEEDLENFFERDNSWIEG